MPLLGHSEETHCLPSSEALLFLSPFKHISAKRNQVFFLEGRYIILVGGYKHRAK